MTMKIRNYYYDEYVQIQLLLGYRYYRRGEVRDNNNPLDGSPKVWSKDYPFTFQDWKSDPVHVYDDMWEFKLDILDELQYLSGVYMLHNVVNGNNISLVLIILALV